MKSSALLTTLTFLLSVTSLTTAHEDWEPPSNETIARVNDLLQSNAKPHFREWYYQSKSFDRYIRNNCTEQYLNYAGGHSDHCAAQGFDMAQCTADGVVTCILENVAENYKADMAAASVLLGLLPSILSMVGIGTLEIGIVARRRPILAFLAAAGGPSVAPTTGYRDVLDLIQRYPDNFDFPAFSWPIGLLIIILQYLYIMGATGNIAYTAWEMGFKAACGFAPHTTFNQLLWAFLAPGIHILGALAIHLRTETIRPTVVDNDDDDTSSSTQYQSQRPPPSRFTRWLKNEFRLCSSQAPMNLRLKKEKFGFALLAWLINSFAVIHFSYGTLVLSSTIFVSTFDALKIVLRFLASVVVCRMVILIEIAGIRSGRGEEERDVDEKEGLMAGERKGLGMGA